MNTIQLDDLTVSRKERILPHGKRTIQQTWTKKSLSTNLTLAHTHSIE